MIKYRQNPDILAEHRKSLTNYPEALEFFNLGLSNPEVLQAPSEDELVEYWNSIFKTDDASPIDGVLGVVNSEVVANTNDIIVSVDLDEVVRESFKGMAALSGNTIAELEHMHNYGSDFFGIEGSIQEFTTTLLRGMMGNDSIEATAELEEINIEIDRLKTMGSIIVANTSTLTGCEFSTIRFLKTHFDNRFDGLVLPRNHDGNGHLTKGDALIEVDKISGERALFTAHIDDSPHHILDVREAAVKMRTDHTDATPLYSWNVHSAEINSVGTPLSAFIYVREDLERMAA